MKPTINPQSTTAGNGRAGNGPKVLEKTLRILDLFTAEHPSWSVSEVARELDMPTATAHRIVRALEDRNYLDRIDSRYRLGFAAVDLGRRAMTSVGLRSRLGPVLRELSRATGETALLTVYDETQHGSLCVDRIEAAQALRLTIHIGRVTPLYAGASAKALLAYLDEATIDEVLDHPFEKLAPGTPADPAALRRDLEQVRRRGWAYSFEENNAGAWGLAAPILIRNQVIASIGIGAPSARHSGAAVKRLAKTVLHAARQAEARLSSEP